MNHKEDDNLKDREPKRSGAQEERTREVGSPTNGELENLVTREIKSPEIWISKSQDHKESGILRN